MFVRKDCQLEPINLIRELIRGIRALIPILIKMTATVSNIRGVSTTIAERENIGAWEPIAQVR